MSVLVGPIAGGLVAGGVRPYCKAASLLLIMHQVYYGFSNLIQSRTEQHRKDLHLLSVRLVDAPTVVPAPPSAASRIAHKPFASLMHEKWNEQVDSAYNWVRTSDRRLEDWGHRLLYGDERSK
ncbi:hypothetical protein CPB85DRAFT_1303541 [Mucidula mucida]|nr:hypothetical protein CPB85DRAFT_1303541 [Mucidula mucida]